MASPAQCLANAANAKFSTGPKTEEGKAKVAKNGIRHGLFAAYEHLAQSDASRIDRLVEDLRAGIPADNPTFEHVVRQYATALWRTGLCDDMEASFLNSAIAEELKDPKSAARAEQTGARSLLGDAIRHDLEGAKVFPTILRYQAQVSRELKRAKETYEKLLYFLASRKTKPKPISSPKADAPQPESPAQATQTSETQHQTPRNAPCPCGSGVKFKRCCGEGAPAVLSAA